MRQPFYCHVQGREETELAAASQAGDDIFGKHNSRQHQNLVRALDCGLFPTFYPSEGQVEKQCSQAYQAVSR